MNVIKKIALSSSIVIISFASVVSANPVYDQLKSHVDTACPIVWEDLGVSISETVPEGDLWQGDATDRSAWVTAYAQSENISTADAEVIAGVTAAVASECASYRTALVDELLANTTSDVTQALTAAPGGAGDYLSGAWMVGDVRMTGRASAASGWVFLTGQTVGGDSSDANLKGAEYRELFEMAKSWAPNSGSESWDAGNIITLPDMRGRTVVGADNLGGSSADIISSAQADVVAGTFGNELAPLSAAQLPTHNHTMNAKGAHNHTMGNDTHSHRIRTSAFEGAGGNRPAGWDYFGKSRPRPGYQATFPANKTILSDTHKHSLTSAPNHTHTINNSGNSAAVNFTQPSITFNVEMKY